MKTGLDTYTDGEANKAATKALIENLEAHVCCEVVYLVQFLYYKVNLVYYLSQI